MAHMVYRCRRREETVAWYLQLFQAHVVFHAQLQRFIQCLDELIPAIGITREVGFAHAGDHGFCLDLIGINRRQG